MSTTLWNMHNFAWKTTMEIKIRVLNSWDKWPTKEAQCYIYIVEGITLGSGRNDNGTNYPPGVLLLGSFTVNPQCKHVLLWRPLMSFSCYFLYANHSSTREFTACIKKAEPQVLTRNVGHSSVHLHVKIKTCQPKSPAQLVFWKNDINW
jgi:hypothetical protein